MNIPRALLDEAVKVSGAKTQTTAVVMGLEELIRKKKVAQLLKLQATGAVKLTQRDLGKMRAR